MDIEIPYNVKEREDTGLYNSKLGIWLFLASEIMLFGALFSTYIILRIGDPTWMLHVKEAHLNIPLATLNTAVLILSSITFVMSSIPNALVVIHWQYFLMQVVSWKNICN